MLALPSRSRAQGKRSARRKTKLKDLSPDVRQLLERVTAGAGAQPLTALDLNMDIQDDGLLHLTEAIRAHAHLNRISVSFPSEVSAVTFTAFVKVLPSLPNLRKIVLREIALGPLGGAAIASAMCTAANIVHLDLSTCDLGDRGLRALSLLLAPGRNQSIRTLHLTDVRSGDEGFCAIAKAMPTNSNIVVLNASNNFATSVAAKAFAGMIAVNTALRQLTLANNWLGPAGAEALAEGLAQNQSLFHLDVSSNAIGDAGVAAIARATATHPRLQRLLLARNAIGPEGAQALATMLDREGGVNFLDLSHNYIGDQGALSLAGTLRTAKAALNRLQLERNRLGSAGVSALADAICGNEHLAMQIIDLANNDFSDEAAPALAALIEAGNRLTSLCMVDSQMGASGALQILKAYRNNSSLVCLELSSDRLVGQVLQEIEEAPRFNERVTSLPWGAKPSQPPTIPEETEAGSGGDEPPAPEGDAPIGGPSSTGVTVRVDAASESQPAAPEAAGAPAAAQPQSFRPPVPLAEPPLPPTGTTPPLPPADEGVPAVVSIAEPAESHVVAPAANAPLAGAVVREASSSLASYSGYAMPENDSDTSDPEIDTDQTDPSTAGGPTPVPADALGPAVAEALGHSKPAPEGDQKLLQEPPSPFGSFIGGKKWRPRVSTTVSEASLSSGSRGGHVAAAPSPRNAAAAQQTLAQALSSQSNAALHAGRLAVVPTTFAGRCSNCFTRVLGREAVVQASDAALFCSDCAELLGVVA